MKPETFVLLQCAIAVLVQWKVCGTWPTIIEGFLMMFLCITVKNFSSLESKVKLLEHIQDAPLRERDAILKRVRDRELASK